MSTVLGDRPEHYERLGLRPGLIESWENGLRTNAAEGSFEWWYLDCHLDDGSELVIIFYTKPPQVSASRPRMPFVSLLLDNADGTHVEKAYLAAADTFFASQDQCNVRIGNNVFREDQGRYYVHVEIDDLTVDVELVPEVPSFRPATGHVFFGAAEDKFVAWLPVVPRGAVDVTLTQGGVRRALRGSAYHDHNWGNTSLRKIIDHWYWARARIGRYTVVALMFVGKQEFGAKELTAFFLAEGERVVASDSGNMRFLAMRASPNLETGVSIAHELVYSLQDGEDVYEVRFVRERESYVLNFAPVGAYIRLAGTAVLEHRRGTTRIERLSASDATWELLHFGA